MPNYLSGTITDAGWFAGFGWNANHDPRAILLVPKKKRFAENKKQDPGGEPEARAHGLEGLFLGETP